MPQTNSLRHSATATAQKTQRQKQPVVRKRIFWLLMAIMFAYLVAHAGLLAGLDTQGQDTKDRAALLEMLSVAAFPLLLLVGYGARTYKWGLWFLVVILFGLTTFNGWLA